MAIGTLTIEIRDHSRFQTGDDPIWKAPAFDDSLHPHHDNRISFSFIPEKATNYLLAVAAARQADWEANRQP